MLTRAEHKAKLSERGRRGAEARWTAYHASIPRPNYGELPDPCFEIIVINHVSKKTEHLVFHPGKKLGSYRIDVNGKFWKSAGWTDSLVRVRKSCRRMAIINI